MQLEGRLCRSGTARDDGRALRHDLIPAQDVRDDMLHAQDLLSDHSAGTS